jgi:CheY-like chemotaxis protein
MSEARTILIIDDDPDYVDAIRRLFETRGDTVWSTSDGRAGIERARAARPDLILLDVMMTERTEGFFTLEQIRRDAVLRETPVIVVSSIYTQCPVFRVDPAAGWLPADAFLPKPVEPATLLEEAARVLGRRAGQRAQGSVAP